MRERLNGHGELFLKKTKDIPGKKTLKNPGFVSLYRTLLTYADITQHS